MEGFKRVTETHLRFEKCVGCIKRNSTEEESRNGAKGL